MNFGNLSNMPFADILILLDLFFNLKFILINTNFQSFSLLRYTFKVGSEPSLSRLTLTEFSIHLFDLLTMLLL